MLEDLIKYLSNNKGGYSESHWFKSRLVQQKRVDREIHRPTHTGKRGEQWLVRLCERTIAKAVGRNHCGRKIETRSDLLIRFTFIPWRGDCRGRNGNNTNIASDTPILEKQGQLPG